MIGVAQKRTPRTAPKGRQQEIHHRLAVLGLARGPRRVLPGEDAAEDEYSRSRRLRSALQSLGPVFASFGLYMASRTDLLPAPECLELAGIPDAAAAMPFAAVRNRIAQELGRPLEEAYAAFEEAPFESRLLAQSHRAWLSSGATVTVRILRPEVEEQLCDLELLSLFRDAFARHDLGEGLEAATADFCRGLRQQTDFSNERRALETLAQDAEEFEMLRAPAVLKDLSTSRILTIEQLPDLSLDNVISSTGGSGSRRKDLARLLCVVWLRQALLSGVFPLQFRPEDVAVLPTKQLAFTGGAFASLPAEPQANLWNYLIAVATEDPEVACSCLLKEMKNGRQPSDEDELRRRFRQFVPFRDGGWNGGDGENTLADHLFIYWRLASERGYVPQEHLPSFYRGLFTVTEIARRVAPDRDVLMEAVQDLRLIAGLEQFRGLTSARQFGELMDKYAGMLTELPQKFDQALTLAADGSMQLKVRAPEAPGNRRLKNSLAMMVALLLLLAAVALIAHHIAKSAAGPWAERINTIVFTLLGTALLWTAGRMR